MQEINASEFRKRCLALMDKLPAEGIVITKHGRPVAQLVPCAGHDAEKARHAIGQIRAAREQLAKRGVQLKDLLRRGESLRDLAHEGHRL